MILNPQFGRPGLPALFVLAAATTTQQQTVGFRLGALRRVISLYNSLDSKQIMESSLHGSGNCMVNWYFSKVRKK